MQVMTFSAALSATPDKALCHSPVFDVTWYAYDRDNQLREMPLVAEVEWALSYDEIKWDFEKLVVARAEHRVMIFQTNDAQRFEDYCRRLVRNITTFALSRKGDRYLLVGYGIKTGRFEYWPFQY